MRPSRFAGRIEKRKSWKRPANIWLVIIDNAEQNVRARRVSLEIIGYRDCSVFSLLFIVGVNIASFRACRASSPNLLLPFCLLFILRLSYFMRPVVEYVGIGNEVQYVLFISQLIVINPL